MIFLHMVIIVSEKIKKSTLVSVCGLTTALSVALLFLGGVSYILSYTVPMIVGIFNIILKQTFGKTSAWITFVSTSLISLMLVSDKECAMMYIFCFGYYPIIQEDINKIKYRGLRVFTKLFIFNLLVALAQLILVYVFCIPFLEDGDSKVFILIFALMMNIIFFFYDIILVRVLFLYKHKFEKHIKRIFR